MTAHNDDVRHQREFDDHAAILKSLETMNQWQIDHDKDEKIQFAELQVHMAQTNEALKKLAVIDERLMGNGHPGLLTRTDRLERTLRVYTFIISGLGTATLGLVARLIFTIITGK